MQNTHSKNKIKKKTQKSTKKMKIHLIKQKILLDL